MIIVFDHQPLDGPDSLEQPPQAPSVELRFAGARTTPTPAPAGARPLRVLTASGGTYLLDPDAMTVVRVHDGEGRLRRDGEPLSLLAWPEPSVGAPMTLLLTVREDGRGPTVRATSTVIDIQHHA